MCSGFRPSIIVLFFAMGCGQCDEDAPSFTPPPVSETEQPETVPAPAPEPDETPDTPPMAVQTPIDAEEAPRPRMDYAAVFTGTHLLVWGGDYAWPDEADGYAEVDPHALADGGRLDLASGAWSAMRAQGAPPSAYDAKAVWTGSEMVVWGGRRSKERVTNTGGRYDPAADRWRRTSLRGAPAARTRHTMVWTGEIAIIWGGEGEDGLLADGARYDPAADVWSRVTSDGAPTARKDHSAIWTGVEMIVWGGMTGSWESEDRALLSTGALYSPSDDRWTAMNQTGSFARESDEGVWTGTHFAVMGECTMDDTSEMYPSPSLGLYDPVADAWTLFGAWSTHARPLVLGDRELISWGGHDGTNVLSDGVRIPLPPRPEP